MGSRWPEFQDSYAVIIPRFNFQQSIFFIIPTLITFLQLMYQGSQENPFRTHPNTMGVAVCASLVYYLACSGQLTVSIGRVSAPCLARYCMTWSGNASVASLASMFAPDLVRPLFYVVSALLSANELLSWKFICYRRSWYDVAQFVTGYFSQQPHILPLWLIYIGLQSSVLLFISPVSLLLNKDRAPYRWLT